MLQTRRALPLDLSHAFRRFREADPERLHFAAHSHHLWPDATRDAHLQVWDDAARLVDDKWDTILGEVWRDAAAGIARVLNLPDPGTLVPAPNTHEFVNRLLSACPADRPSRVLTTDGEFHSLRRQLDRLAEDGLVEVTAVPAEPFATLTERLIAAARDGAPDLVFVSQVLFGSGLRPAGPGGPGGRRLGPGPARRPRRLPRLPRPPDGPRADRGQGLLPRGRLQVRHERRGRLLHALPAGGGAAPAQHGLVRELRHAVRPSGGRRLRRGRLALHGGDLRPVRRFTASAPCCAGWTRRASTRR